MFKVGAILITAMLVIAAAPLNPPIPSSGHTQGQHQPTPSKETDNRSSDQRGTQATPFIVRVVDSNVHQAVAAKSQDEGYWYANPDWWVAAFTAALFIATGGLWVVTWLLWSSTKTLLGNESDHTARELRAYISIEPVGINVMVGSTNTIGMVDVRNVGKIPARNVAVIVRMHRYEDKNFDFPNPREPEASTRTIQPGAQMRQGSQDYVSTTDYKFVDSYIFVWGIARYDDGYGKERFTRFCHRYSVASHDRAWQRIENVNGRRIIMDLEKARYHPKGNEAD